MDPLMPWVVGWTLVGGFVFTVVVTLLSLVGMVEFADPKQQRMLFKLLVVELLVGVGGKVAGAWRFDAKAVGADVHAEGALDGGAAVGEAWIASQATPEAAEISRAAVMEAVEELRLPEASKAGLRRNELIEGLRVAPARCATCASCARRSAFPTPASVSGGRLHAGREGQSMGPCGFCACGSASRCRSIGRATHCRASA